MSQKPISREDFKRIVLGFVQPLHKGVFDKVSKLSASLKDLLPFGTADRVQHASPYGFVSSPPPGTQAFFLNLHGNSQAPIIVTHLDLTRPPVDESGATVLYCLNADKTLTPVRVTLSPMGKLTLDAAEEIDLVCKLLKFGKASAEFDVVGSKIRLGSLTSAEPLVLGNQLKTLLANILTDIAGLANELAVHTHAGNLGYPTSPPNDTAAISAFATMFDQLKASPVNDKAILSNIAFTEKGS